jgi:hypothetical protein
MDIRKQLIILILVLLCAPVSAQKKEKLITLKFTNIPLSEAMPKVEKQSGYIGQQVHCRFPTYPLILIHQFRSNYHCW